MLVGHVTKDGAIAGPRVLEHLVDVVLHFEGDRHSSLRLVRATKNRYGAADEVGCFEMREDGIVGLADPSGLFLSDRGAAVAGTCVTVTLEGRRPLVTEVQALATRGIRRRFAAAGSERSGLRPGGHAARGAHAPRTASRGRSGGLRGDGRRHRRHEPAADLAIALALASAARGIALPPTVCAIGEVSLSGDVRRVPGLDRRLAEAARLGFTTALVPAGQHDRLTTDMVTRPVRQLEQRSRLPVHCAGLATAPDPPRPLVRPPDPSADAGAPSRRRAASKRR